MARNHSPRYFERRVARNGYQSVDKREIWSAVELRFALRHHFCPLLVLHFPNRTRNGKNVLDNWSLVDNIDHFV